VEGGDHGAVGTNSCREGAQTSMRLRRLTVRKVSGLVY